MIEIRETGVKFTFQKIVDGEGVEFHGTLTHDEVDFVLQTGFITLLGAGAFAIKNEQEKPQATPSELVN